MVDEIFLVVRHDRHTDDIITAHRTREGADSAVDDWLAGHRFGGLVNWVEVDPIARRPDRVRTVVAHDDDPWIHIERVGLA